MTLRLRHANQDAMTGLVIALSGWFAIGLAHLVAVLVTFVSLLACICAVLAVILGSQVLNIRRIPPWARPFVGKPPPNMALGALTIILALSLFFGALVWN